MNIDQHVKEHLMDFPLDLTDILRACVSVVGLSDVLSGIGELFGNSGQEDEDTDAVMLGGWDRRRTPR